MSMAMALTKTIRTKMKTTKVTITKTATNEFLGFWWDYLLSQLFLFVAVALNFANNCNENVNENVNRTWFNH